MSNKDMFLWWGSGSAPCWKVMLVLAEKGLMKDLPNKLIEFSKKEHKSDDIMKLNPRGQVPTFKDGDLVVNESDAACMYLEDKYSTDANRLMPTDIPTRAMVRQRMAETQSIQGRIMLPLVYYKMRTPKESWDEAMLKTSLENAQAEVQLWETYLTGSEYLVGDSFTMADCFFAPWLFTLVRQGMSLEGRPALKKYYEKLQSRESVQSTMPPHWKDSPSPNSLADL